MTTLSIQVDCKPEEVAQLKALLAKYTFTAEGIRKIDGYMTKTDFFVTPVIKTMVRKR